MTNDLKMTEKVNNTVEELYRLRDDLKLIGEEYNVGILLHQAINIATDDKSKEGIIKFLEEVRDKWKREHDGLTKNKA